MKESRNWPLAVMSRQYSSYFGEPSGPTGLDAGILAAHGFDLPDAGHEPLYLRRPDADVPRAPKSALPQARLSFGGPRG